MRASVLVLLAVVAASPARADEADDLLARQLAAVVRDTRLTERPRTEAARALARMGLKASAAVPQLMQQLDRLRGSEFATLQEAVIDALGLSGRPEALDPLQKGMKKFMVFKDGEPLVVVRTYTNEFHLATNRLAQFPRLGPVGWRRHLLTKELPAQPVH